jgi:uncharacterized protein (TIGR02246 family)
MNTARPLFKRSTALLLSHAVALLLVVPSLSAAATAGFGAIEDRLQIEDLCARYVMALDTSDGDEYSSLFTQDAVLDINGRQTETGRTAIRKMIDGFKAMQPQATASSDRVFGPVRHVVTSLVLNIRGTTATGESYWMEVQSNGRDHPPTVFNIGRYEDEFVKLHGKWLLHHRKIIADIGYEPTLPGAPAAAPPK